MAQFCHVGGLRQLYTYSLGPTPFMKASNKEAGDGDPDAIKHH